MNEMPPLPGGDPEVAADDEFLGISRVQDRAIGAIHTDGWTLRRLFKEPRAMLPLPEARFPAGRVYMCSDDVAVVVHRATGRIITSLPLRAALQTLHQLAPDVLAADEWASARWEELQTEPDGDSSTRHRHNRQDFYSADGARWGVQRMTDGAAAISRDGKLLHRVASAEEADDLGMDPVVSELVAFVVENP